MNLTDHWRGENLDLVYKPTAVGKSECIVIRNAEAHLTRELADMAPYVGTLPQAEFRMKLDEASQRVLKRIMADAVGAVAEEHAREVVRKAICNHANMQNEPWRRRGKRRGQGWCVP